MAVYEHTGEAVPVITGGPTLAVATTLITCILNLIREMGKVPSADSDCSCGQGAQGRSS
jgi:hypothetical protein